MEFYQSIKDSESPIKLDQKTLRAYQKKEIVILLQKNIIILKTIDEVQMKDASYPEIKALLIRDPRIQQLFKDFKVSCFAQQAIMKDEFIRNAFQKLVAAGLVKTK